MRDAHEALERLRAGNRRFVDGTHGQQEGTGAARRSELVNGQNPFAAILGCADSRVCPEFAFDQGLGELFVVQVAGNVAASIPLASLEYAAEHLGVPLIVVLGHQSCGAVSACLGALRSGGEAGSENLQALIEWVTPAVAPLLEAEDVAEGGEAALVQRAVEANVRWTVDQLPRDSEILRRHLDDGSLTILGAVYSLETGEVTFFDGAEAG